MKVQPFHQIEEISAFRRRLGLNQVNFWSAIGVTQSGGSRYESDRKVPAHVAEIMRLFYVEKIDTKSIVGSMAKKVRIVIESDSIDEKIATASQELARINAEIERKRKILEQV